MSIRGTNLGIQSSDVLSVTIGDSTCDVDYSEYIPGKRFPYLFTCIYSCLLICLHVYIVVYLSVYMYI